LTISLKFCKERDRGTTSPTHSEIRLTNRLLSPNVCLTFLCKLESGITTAPPDILKWFLQNVSSMRGACCENGKTAICRCTQNISAGLRSTWFVWTFQFVRTSHPVPFLYFLHQLVDFSGNGPHCLVHLVI
jgi:hypothetical protein